MGVAQSKSLLLLGVTFERDLPAQNLFGFCLLLFSTSQCEEVLDWSPLAIAGRRSVSFEGGLLAGYKHATSQACLCVEGTVSTTGVTAEWQLAQEERVETLHPRPGRRDAQLGGGRRLISAQWSRLWGCPPISSLSYRLPLPSSLGCFFSLREK